MEDAIIFRVSAIRSSLLLTNIQSPTFSSYASLIKIIYADFNLVKISLGMYGILTSGYF